MAKARRIIGVTGADQAEHEITMSADELGRALEREVCSHPQGLLQQRRGERRVHRDLDRLVPERRKDPVEFGDLDQRVAGTLKPEQRGVLGSGEGRLGVGGIDLRQHDPALLRSLVQQTARPSVAGGGSDHPGAGWHCLEDRCCRTDPGRERGGSATLEDADRLLQRRPCGRALLTRVGAAMEVRGQNERRIQRAPLDPISSTGVNGHGGQMKVR